MADEAVLLEALKNVIDPELMVNVVDLGLIYSIEENDGKVDCEMTLTSPMCPAGPQLIANSKQTLTQLDEVEDVEVKIVLEPAWSPDRMTEDARDQLGIF